MDLFSISSISLSLRIRENDVIWMGPARKKKVFFMLGEKWFKKLFEIMEQLWGSDRN